MRYEKKNLTTTLDDTLIASIMKDYELSREVVEIIASRGYTTREQIVSYLEPENFKYYSPNLLSGMIEAVEIIKNAVKSKKRITVLGDYDTDGICSTAILYKYFESVGIKIDYFLPNRFVDGYGLTMDTVDKIIELYNPELLITVDCGISSYKEIAYAKQRGLQVIVTDHHEVPEILPECVIINPKLPNQKYPFSELCGAGVALKLVQALAGFSVAQKYVSIASFATIADIVPLVDENRAIVKNGLKNYKKHFPKGLLRLIEKFNISDLQPSDVSYRVAPKINTAGRMGDASMAFRLFVEEDVAKIENDIEKLLALNEIRVSDGNEIFDEALQMLEGKQISKMRAIVLNKDDWNGGVLGIVCAKLVEKYNKPVVLFSKIENEHKGSARSIEGVDIYKEMSSLSDILIRFGGHSQAGGLSIEYKYLHEFEKRLNENLAKNYSEEVFEEVKRYDLDLDTITLDDKFLQQMSKLEPFGFGNEKPVFKVSFNNVKVSQMKNFDAHLKLQIANLDIVAFNYFDYFNALKANCKKEALVEINSHYKHRNRRLINAKLLSLKFLPLQSPLSKDIVSIGLIRQLNYISSNANKKPVVLNKHNFNVAYNNTFKKSMFGTLVVSSHFANYQNFVKEYGQYFSNFELFDINNKTLENTVLFAPNNLKELSGYENVIFLEPFLVEGFVNAVQCENVYISLHYKNKPETALKTLDTNRNTFAIYHNAIVNYLKSQQSSENENDFVAKVVKFNPKFKNLKNDQFVFVILVLQELGILSLKKEESRLIVGINKNVKNPLENSKIYNFVRFNNKIV